jgi:hypothetical protein
VLEKQGNGYSGITGVHVKGRPALCGRQEDFGQPSIIKATDAGRIPDATVLKID